MLALQLALDPPLVPLQVQFQGPDQPTAEGDQTPQRLLVGAEVNDAPFEEPQTPSVLRFALQLAVVPPLVPLQVQFQGPDQPTAEGDQTPQRLLVGAEVNDAPFEEPQTPSVLRFALQLAVVPPLVPLQVQFQGPDQPTAEGVPVLQRLVLGAEFVDEP